MKYGVVIFATDFAIRPDELAKAVEDRGFESLFFPEHTHIPASRRTPYPLGGELPKEYSHTLDPLVAMTMAAAATSKLKVATGVCLVIEHDPIVLAKQVAQRRFGLEWPCDLRHWGRLERGGDGRSWHCVQVTMETAARTD